MKNQFRAYDTTTDWSGPARATEREAYDDAERHNNGCARQSLGAYGSAVVARREGDRLVDLDGNPIWPSHGRTTGAARWVEPEKVEVDVSDLRITYHTPREMQGQIIEVSYAGLSDGRVLRRTLDRSDHSETYAVADLASTDDEVVGVNGMPQIVGKWRACTVKV